MSHEHDYVIIRKTGDGMLEVCSECKKRNIIRNDLKGRIDNKQYLKDHVRDTAQPHGRTSKIFNKYYKPKQ